ncbi:MAG: CvpA family protein [Arsenophonus sp.]|nr:MAG: CvpA family protein [Arsenophonus sp.]
MVWIDYIIIIIITFSSLMGVINGFIKEFFSLAIWCSSFIISNKFYSYLTTYITYFENILLKNIISIAIIFIATLIIGSIFMSIFISLIKYTGLSSTDRVLGLCFGMFKGIVIISAIIFVLDHFTSLSLNEYWKQSEFIPHFNKLIKLFIFHFKEKIYFLL